MALAKLSRPNVVPVLDVGVEGEEWVVAMELRTGAGCWSSLVARVERSLLFVAHGRPLGRQDLVVDAVAHSLSNDAAPHLHPLGPAGVIG